MKKLILTTIFLIGLFTSCSVNSDKEEYRLEVLPIKEVVIPNSFILGESYTIKLYYNRPTSCYIFNGIYYDKNLNTQTIAIETIVFDNNNCEPLNNDVSETSFDFKATNNETYIFKFWNGVNNAGEDVFLEYEIPVN